MYIASLVKQLADEGHILLKDHNPHFLNNSDSCHTTKLENYFFRNQILDITIGNHWWSDGFYDYLIQIYWHRPNSRLNIIDGWNAWVQNKSGVNFVNKVNNYDLWVDEPHIKPPGWRRLINILQPETED